MAVSCARGMRREAFFALHSLPQPVPPVGEYYDRPEVITLGVTDITNNTATLSGDLTDLGSAARVKVYFRYGTS